MRRPHARVFFVCKPTLANSSPTCDPDVSFQSGLVFPERSFGSVMLILMLTPPQTSSSLVCPPAFFSCHDVLGGRSVPHTGPFVSSRHRGHVCIPCLSRSGSTFQKVLPSAGVGVRHRFENVLDPATRFQFDTLPLVPEIRFHCLLVGLELKGGSGPPRSGTA